MAWYRAGGGGISASLKTGMNDVLNKKFGTSTTYAPAGWPDNVNLLGKLPEKTVSGSIAHIDDGADRVPVKAWGVTLGASLTGVSSVDVVHCGKNLWKWGDVTANRYKEVYVSIPMGTYTISVETLTSDASPSYCQLVWTTTAGTQYSPLDYSTKKATITLNADATKITFYSAEDYSSSGGHIATFENIQLETGNQATTYAPYSAETNTVSLGRTIYGGSVDVIAGTGTDENGNDFTFTPITPTPETKLGVNNFWADEGDSSVTYRRDIDLALGGG